MIQVMARWLSVYLDTYPSRRHRAVMSNGVGRRECFLLHGRRSSCSVSDRHHCSYLSDVSFIRQTGRVSSRVRHLIIIYLNPCVTLAPTGEAFVVVVVPSERLLYYSVRLIRRSIFGTLITEYRFVVFS